MADREESLLHGEFSAYRSALMDEVHPLGPAAVRATVRRRRRLAVSGATALTLALIAGPAVGYAALHHHDPVTPTPADSGGPTDLPTPTLTPSTPSPTLTPSAGASPTAGKANGRINRTDLLAARLDLPAWGSVGSCPTRGVRLVETKGDVGEVVLEDSTRGLRYVDVDGDGMIETLAVLECLTPDVMPQPQQVVAFDRDSTGRIIARGQVAHTNRGEWFRSFDVRPERSVRIEVWENPPSDGSSPDPEHRQWRTYRWGGDRFVQK